MQLSVDWLFLFASSKKSINPVSKTKFNNIIDVKYFKSQLLKQLLSRSVDLYLRKYLLTEYVPRGPKTFIALTWSTGVRLIL